jgi:hypothetical protein
MTREEKIERIISCIDQPLCRDLCRYFAKAGWDIEVIGQPLRVEATMDSGHGSGATVIDLVNLTVFILEKAP